MKLSEYKIRLKFDKDPFPADQEHLLAQNSTCLHMTG